MILKNIRQKIVENIGVFIQNTASNEQKIFQH
jgi:hypothetical protein